MIERMLSQTLPAGIGSLPRVHGVTLRDKVRSCQILKVLKCRATFPNREISAMLVRPCDHNVPRKLGEASPAGYTHRKATQKSSKDQVEWLHLRPCSVPSWCGASRTIHPIAENCEVFCLLPGLLAPPSSQVENRKRNWWICHIFSSALHCWSLT